MHWKRAPGVSIVSVPAGHEIAVRDFLATSPEAHFAELDVFPDRQSVVLNDPKATNQWHHPLIGSTNAWTVAGGSPSIRVAIVDDPFQMDHPDLAPHVVPGWNVSLHQAVTASSGLGHSTLAAGLIAAVTGNAVGVAGLTRCSILPVAAPDYSISQIHNAIIWAADHGARVVNVSWNVAHSPTLNAAGEYLRDRAQGIFLVSADNPRRLYSFPNHPFIIAVGMTDDRDASVSGYGDFIDLTAPGWNVYSTTIAGAYDGASGTSFAAPIVAGIAAHLLAINPSLTTAQLTNILQQSVADLGAPGWDPFFGAGRVNFAAAARAAFDTLPVSRIQQFGPRHFAAIHDPRATLQLLAFDEPGTLPRALPSVLASTNNGLVHFLVEGDLPSSSFFQLKISLP